MEETDLDRQKHRVRILAFLAFSLFLGGLLVVCALRQTTPGLPISIPMPAPLPPIRLLTVFVAIHLIGLCFGLGGATMLDFWILRWMRQGSMPPEIKRSFLFISKVVTVGLAALWLSGLGLLAIYALEAPEKLANPKLWAKILVVLVLTLNGAIIHALVLPSVVRDISRPMFEGVSRPTAGIFFVSGAVSGVSWYFAFALGVMRELNGVVGTGCLLSLWFIGVVGASCLTALLRQFLMRPAVHPVSALSVSSEQGVPPAKQDLMSTPLRRLPPDIFVSVRRAA
ncbi:hypothetical protein [Methylobacterium gossipiicola]|uniref:Uncharacterized protein n=1 Tax=Methylobacterium gossipiicola TaxID=582675 RepID=A0A1I2X296_9HYPH|nr:hypothetical protein [Methylobacterium gossipiicola]SFH07674.1 hypothetical protein SAMN05192565_13116 [Methylobacterium gossipiicola]